ncbi:MAG TPA: lipoprotein [Xanthobacteraceae bacterium]|nr:lipoprotein [Xanthobacteraceae bacterium]
MDRRSYLARLAVLGAAMAALALAGCGRKGPLDPPPVAAEPTPSAAPARQSSVASPTASLNGKSESKGPSVFTRHGQPVAPPGPKVHLPIDWLID